MKKKKVISFVLAGALVMGAGQAWAATTHYNDSSVVRGTGEWSDWVQGWDEMAADFTQVSLTPGNRAEFCVVQQGNQSYAHGVFRDRWGEYADI